MILKIYCVSMCIVLHLLYISAQINSQTRVGYPVRRRGRYRGSVNQTTYDPERVVEQENGDDSENEPSDNVMMSLLHKINDRLTAISVISEQQMRKFETFEYRMTKLEVQIQEKTDGLRSDLKEVARRVQQIDWQSSKTDSALDALKVDTSFLKQAVEHFRISPSHHDREVAGSADVGLDVSNKLQMTLRSVQTLLNGFSSLQSDISVLKRNITKISNSTSNLGTLLPEVLTTKHFQRSLLELERQTYRPVCSIRQTADGDFTPKLPKDCNEVQSAGANNKSGVYRIQPPHATAAFFVYCDLETREGGWTVIQRRNEGTLDFYKGWHDYKHGFGNIGGEFWLGLEKLHLLTNYQVNEIYIELEDFSFEKTYAQYSAFAIGSEVEGYPISFLGTYDGTAGDSLLYHAGQKFSTFDLDHDNWAEGNCAQSHTGAWWYNGCDTSNLNGRYLNGELPDQYEYHGMYWYEWRGPKYSLKSSKIMIRPRKENFAVMSDTDITSTNDSDLEKQPLHSLQNNHSENDHNGWMDN